MSAEAPPQIPTPDLSFSNSGYVDLDPTQAATSAPEPAPASAPASEPATQTNGGYSLEGAKNTLVNSAQSAMDTVQNSSIAQQAVNGPIGQGVKDETAKTQSEFRDLANARRTPDQPAATGQPLTHYHSMFYRLLSWKNPRATSISFACSIIFIFAARYVNIVRYIFKLLWVTLGCTALAEVAGKATLGQGFTTQMRPRKYWMIRKDSLERLTDDLEQLINFFVIEFQRVVFVENIYVSAACFVASFISYFLIKWLPLWGLSLIGTIVIYMGPLVYIQNKELIDEYLEQTNHMLNEEANRLKGLAAEHSARAQDQLKVYANEYSAKAQDMIGQAKSKAFPSRSRPVTPSAPAQEMAQEKIPVKEADFPEAPKQDIKVEQPAVVEKPKGEGEASLVDHHVVHTGILEPGI